VREVGCASLPAVFLHIRRNPTITPAKIKEARAAVRRRVLTFNVDLQKREGGNLFEYGELVIDVDQSRPLGCVDQPSTGFAIE
jgi:hypothetical protein